MTPLAALLAGHFVGDWIVQTDWQAANKACPTFADGSTKGYLAEGYWRSWKANQQHMLGYHLTVGVFAALALSWHYVLVVLVVSWVTHSIIDRRWPVRKLCDFTGSHGFGQTTFGVIAVDQALHLTILCLLAGAVR